MVDPIESDALAADLREQVADGEVTLRELRRMRRHLRRGLRHLRRGRKHLDKLGYETDTSDIGDFIEEGEVAMAALGKVLAYPADGSLPGDPDEDY